MRPSLPAAAKGHADLNDGGKVSAPPFQKLHLRGVLTKLIVHKT